MNPPPWRDRAVGLWHRLLAHGSRHALPQEGGNAVALLPCGGSILEATRTLIREARHTLHGEIYAWEEDATGRDLVALFQAARDRGVDVRLVVDHLGSWGGRSLLGGSGLNLRFYHPLSWRLPWRLWHKRNHRKLLVADGQRAVVGSANWSDAYNCELNRACYRDLGVLLQGPVVPHLEADFTRAWRRAGGAELPECVLDVALGPLPQAYEDVDIQVVSSLMGGGRVLRRHLSLWLSRVQRTVCIANAYFIPGPLLVHQLARAARRGVEVGVLVPGSSDHPFVQAASRATYAPLLAAGVRVWERQEVMLHAKAAVMDRELVVLGSANLDSRSFRHNLELNLVLRHGALARDVENLLERDRTLSTPITAQDWAQRSRWQKAWQRFAHLFWWWL